MLGYARVPGELAGPGQGPLVLAGHHAPHVPLKVAEHREPPDPRQEVVVPRHLEQQITFSSLFGTLEL